MVTTVRSVSLAVTFAGNVLTDVLSARGNVTADGGWPTCSVFVTRKPETGNEEDDLDVVAGAGNNVTRFTGKLRQFRSSGFPKSLEMVCEGTLAYADEWAPQEDIELEELLGLPGGTDQDIVLAALSKVPRLSFVAGDIDGTGIVLGTLADDAYRWRAGTSAWTYVQQIDRATLYRTYQGMDGTVRRVKMIGHPSSVETSFTLSDTDILDGSSGHRDTTRTRNAVVVQGYDPGTDKGGPFTNADGTYGTNDFLGDGSDPDTRYVETFASPLIESGTNEDGTPDGDVGLNAHDIAEEILADVNKEFVEATVMSWRDDTHGPGQTCLLDCLNRLAIGELMWVQGYSWEVGENGWQSTYSLSGGGLPQDYEPPPV